MLEHRYDIRISESYVDPNPLMVEIQDPDNFTRFQTRERCALEIAAYVFKGIYLSKAVTCMKIFLYKQELLFCQGDGYLWPHCCMNNLYISHR